MILKLKRFLKLKHRQRALNSAIGALGQRDEFHNVPEELLEKLRYGWGNTGYSARTESLKGLMQRAASARGPVVECGSGLSTVMLGIAAKQSGHEVWALEHVPEWAAHTQKVLDRHGLDNVHLEVTPLEQHDAFDWYGIGHLELPQFSLVFCDGPPAQVRGGRVGMPYVLGPHLAPGCEILLDDTDREGERAILAHWQQRFDWMEMASEAGVFVCFRKSEVTG